jgi:multidrug resistance efflux pump
VADLTAEAEALFSKVARLQSENEELNAKLEEADTRWRRQTKLNKMVGAAFSKAFEKAHAAMAEQESVKPEGQITNFFKRVELSDKTGLDDNMAPLCNKAYEALTECVYLPTLRACEAQCTHVCA